MNILISQKIGLNQYGTLADSLESNYIRFFSSLDSHCFPVSNFSPDIPGMIRQLKINGIVLTGGNDVHEENDYIQYRNETEATLLRFAIKNHIPLLGICRGMQFMHHYFKGKLKNVERHVRVTHPIILESPKLYKGSKKPKKVIVDSYHARALDESTLSSDFNVIARCKRDRSIEAIAHKKHPILGIMWHPERDYLKQDKKFNQNLVRHFFNI